MERTDPDGTIRRPAFTDARYQRHLKPPRRRKPLLKLPLAVRKCWGGGEVNLSREAARREWRKLENVGRRRGFLRSESTMLRRDPKVVFRNRWPIVWIGAGRRGANSPRLVRWNVPEPELVLVINPVQEDHRIHQTFRQRHEFPRHRGVKIRLYLRRKRRCTMSCCAKHRPGGIVLPTEPLPKSTEIRLRNPSRRSRSSSFRRGTTSLAPDEAGSRRNSWITSIARNDFSRWLLFIWHRNGSRPAGFASSLKRATRCVIADRTHRNTDEPCGTGYQPVS